MTRPAIAFFLFALTAGCYFDEERQVNIRYPATLVFANDTTVPVRVDTIASSLEPEHAFVFNQNIVLAPGQSLRRRIMEETFDAIRAGHFVVYGACGVRKQWEADGRTLARDSVRSIERWDVTVRVGNCGP